MDPLPELSVVIPAYNEEKVIAQTLEAVTGYFEQAHVPHEILVVDDGSTDRTAETVARLATRLPVRLLRGPHRGKGAAVKLGMLDARGGLVLFTDADLSTPIAEWEKFAPWLRDGYDVVIGSRKVGGAEIRVHQPWLRETLGKGFTWLTNLLLGTSASDITCGFKCFAAPAARRAFALQRLDGWGFDAEILFIARRLGLRIREVPVVWTDDAATKVRLGRDVAWSLLELLAVRVGAWQGHYPRTPGRPTGEHGA
jgi:dolichyl-phosphate beta-glucosyltransferase